MRQTRKAQFGTMPLVTWNGCGKMTKGKTFFSYINYLGMTWWCESHWASCRITPNAAISDSRSIGQNEFPAMNLAMNLHEFGDFPASHVGWPVRIASRKFSNHHWCEQVFEFFFDAVFLLEFLLRLLSAPSKKRSSGRNLCFVCVVPSGNQAWRAGQWTIYRWFSH